MKRHIIDVIMACTRLPLSIYIASEQFLFFFAIRPNEVLNCVFYTVNSLLQQ